MKSSVIFIDSKLYKDLPSNQLNIYYSGVLIVFGGGSEYNQGDGRPLPIIFLIFKNYSMLVTKGNF